MVISDTNKKRYIIFGIYVGVLIYFMFFGFGRPQMAELREYRYSLIPVRIPLWVPKHISIDNIRLWIFTLGNLLAFVPFGILIPTTFRKHVKTYSMFILLFVLFILFMETLQMVTYLGSFDVDDIIINTIGASIGFFSYKVSKRAKILRMKIVSLGLSIAGFTLLMFLISRIFNNTITPYLINTFGLY